MTVSSAVRKAGPYTGNGSQTVYPFAFKIYTKIDIEVVTADVNGLETTLVVDSGYTVTINADQDNNPGGYITLTTALTINYSLVILGNLLDQQLTDLTNLGGFFPQTVEDMADRNTILIQQLEEKADRSVQVPATSNLDPGDLVDTIVAAGTAATNFFGVYYGAYPSNPSVDPLGNPPNSGDMYYNTVAHQLLIYDAALLTWTTQPSGASMTSNIFTGTGAQVNFTLSTTPYTINNLLVYVGGVAQRPTTDYTVVGTTLTFAVAPPNAANNVLAFVLNSILIGSIDGANIFNTVNVTKLKYDTTGAETLAAVTIVNSYYPPGNVLRYGTNTSPGVTNMTAAIQAAHNQGMQTGGARPYLPSGTYLITTTITPCQLGMYGDGSKSSVISCNAVDCFTIPAAAGWTRSPSVFERFGIRSNDGLSCDTKYAFYAPGVAGGAAVAYNIGLTVRDIAIGLSGSTISRMGGGFYLKDFFDVTIENIIGTDVTYLFRIVGSVAQLSVSNVRALLGDAGQGAGLANIGFSTESAVYASGTLTPEHVTTRDMCLIVFNTGLQHAAGLDCNFYDTDIQAISIGMSLNAQCDVDGAIIIPHTAGVGSWTGVLLSVNPGPKEGRFLTRVEVSMGNVPGTPATSYGFDMGDGVSPVYGVTLHKCSVRGQANSLQSLIRGRIHKDLTMENCILEAAVALGTEVSLSSVQRLSMSFNQCPSGIFAVGDGGDASANGVIVGNQITTLTLAPLTSPQNWTTGQNDGLTPVRHAWEQGTVTLTLTGCATAPTVVASWVKNGLITIINIPTLQAVSNTVACSLTGLPANLQPNNQQDVLGRAIDNGLNGICGYRFTPASGTIGMFFGPSLGAWTNGGNKGVNNSTLVYSQA